MIGILVCKRLSDGICRDKRSNEFCELFIESDITACVVSVE